MRECSPSTMSHMSCFTCQVSGVRCQVSGVRCHVSRVRCHMSGVTFQFFFGVFLQSGENSRWRVCYQRGLPRLVFNIEKFELKYGELIVLTRQIITRLKSLSNSSSALFRGPENLKLSKNMTWSDKKWLTKGL